jgi:hypothetical protein
MGRKRRKERKIVWRGKVDKKGKRKWIKGRMRRVRVVGGGG